MPQIHLDEQLYMRAERRAADAGFASVDAYVADLLAGRFSEEGPEMTQFFTDDRLREIDAADAEVEAGNLHTEEAVQRHFEARFLEATRKGKAG